VLGFSYVWIILWAAFFCWDALRLDKARDLKETTEIQRKVCVCVFFVLFVSSLVNTGLVLRTLAVLLRFTYLLLRPVCSRSPLSCVDICMCLTQIDRFFCLCRWDFVWCVCA
jgi:hypothetical protein